MIVRKFPIVRYNRGVVEHPEDPVVVEAWLELYLNGRYAMGTPVIDREIEELIYGYLFMEGYISAGERVSIRKKPSGYFVDLGKEADIQSVKELVDCAYSKIVFKEDIKPLPPGKRYDADFILDLGHDFHKLPSVYHDTGGVHMAALAGERGILFWADDISRRNALDKVLGKMFLAGKGNSGGLVLTSGRISSDVVVRLIRAGLSVIASISAPTAKAVELADAYGITLCGFVRGRRMNVYTHQERIIFGGPT